MKRSTMKKLTAILLVLCMTAGLALCMTACGSAASYDAADTGYTYADYGNDDVAEEADYAEAAYYDEGGDVWSGSTGSGTGDDTSYLSGLKIIKTGDLSIDSEQFDETDAFIREKVTAYQGILAETSISGTTGSRWASYTVRIPSASFDSFFYDVAGECVVTYQSISSEDVTEQYTDLQTRLTTDQAKYERLLELLEKAETLTDIYSIQSEISDVEYEIDSITGTLNGLDSRISYSTIYINVTETTRAVAVPTEQSFSAKLAAALKNGASRGVEGLQNLLLSIARGWVGWMIFIIIVVVAVLIIRHIVRRSEKRTEKQAAGNDDHAPTAGA